MPSRNVSLVCLKMFTTSSVMLMTDNYLTIEREIGSNEITFILPASSEGVEWGWEREDPEGKLGKAITFEMQIHKISDQNKYIQKYTLNKWKIIADQKKKKKKESKKNGETRYTHVLTLQMMLSVLFLLSTILVIVLCYGLFYIIIFLPRNSFFGVFSHELVDIIQRVLSVFITMTWFITISVLQPMSHMCERLLHLLPCVLNDPCISGMKQIFSWLKK